MNVTDADAAEGWSPTHLDPRIRVAKRPPRLPGRDGDTLPSQGPEGDAFSDTLIEGPQRGVGLCVGVDDAGLHPGTNGAAVELAMAGRAQAIACRVAAPAWSLLVPQLARLRGMQIGIGLQLDLSDHLFDLRSRRSVAAWMLGLARVPRAQLQQEIVAQLAAFETATGFVPDFVCGHRHVHQAAAVRSLLLNELTRRYAPGERPWVRAARPGEPAAGRSGLLRNWALARSAGRLIDAAQERGLKTNRHQLGRHDFDGGLLRYRALVSDWLALAREGDVLVCHPSLPVVAGDRWLPARVAQHQFFMGRDWPVLLERHDLRLQPMRQLLARRSRW